MSEYWMFLSRVLFCPRCRIATREFTPVNRCTRCGEKGLLYYPPIGKEYAQKYQLITFLSMFLGVGGSILAFTYEPESLFVLGIGFSLMMVSAVTMLYTYFVYYKIIITKRLEEETINHYKIEKGKTKTCEQCGRGYPEHMNSCFWCEWDMLNGRIPGFTKTQKNNMKRGD